MKRIVSLALALLLALAALAVPAMAEPPRVIRTGVLTMLNMTEEEVARYIEACALATSQLGREGYGPEDMPDVPPEEVPEKPEVQVVFYDTLDAMLMGLQAGDIDVMNLYSTTAEYLCENNDDLVIAVGNDFADADGAFADAILDGLLSNDFAFMMMESNAELCEQFNQVIADIATDEEGTLANIAIDHLISPIIGDDFVPVEIEKIDGAETLKVAVTGSLPPMDYVAPDGSPAGFSTAILAEISKRIGKNLELVVVDSIGRAAALASGTVDVVFWTRTNSESNEIAEMDEAEREENLVELQEDMTEQEVEILKQVGETIDYGAFGRSDMPEGTIVTDGYYTDTIVVVALKGSAMDLQPGAEAE